MGVDGNPSPILSVRAVGARWRVEQFEFEGLWGMTNARMVTRVPAVTGGAAVAAALTLAVPQTAVADTRPSAPTPATVAVDGLPTVQIDGVVWSQAVVGNTVYADGDFRTARPAGAAAGTNTVARTHLLAYDIRTGGLITSFRPGPERPGPFRGRLAERDPRLRRG